MAAPSIRPIRAEDAVEVAAAERECFPDPWSEAGIQRLLQDETVFGLVAGDSVGLAGYLLARTIAGEAEILNLAVLPRARRQGLARRLLDRGLAAARERGARSAFLEVRESNDAARNLYLGRGFHPVGLRPAYYRRPTENAVVLQLDLSAPR